MLPAHRVIGHKEYGNTAPGGWSGRKQDPQYDMNWRRQRVAAFIPRGDDMPLNDADIQRIEDTVRVAVWCMTPPGETGPWPIHRLAGIDDKTGVTEHLARTAAVNAEFAAYVLDGKLPPGADPERVVPAIELVNGRVPAAGGGELAAGSPAPLTDDQLARVLTRPDVAGALGDAVAAALDRRSRDGDPATGPAT